MLFQKIDKLTAVYPQLSRVWIRTEDPKQPLKSVWIDEAAMHAVAGEEPTSDYPPLSRVWIWTEDPRMPLKSVLIDVAEMHALATEAGELIEAELIVERKYALVCA